MYTVIENEIGCLPESDPETFDNASDARDYAQTLASDLRDCGYKVTGNKRDGYTGTRGHSTRVVEIVKN